MHTHSIYIINFCLILHATILLFQPARGYFDSNNNGSIKTLSWLQKLSFTPFNKIALTKVPTQ